MNVYRCPKCGQTITALVPLVTAPTCSRRTHSACLMIPVETPPEPVQLTMFADTAKPDGTRLRSSTRRRHR